MKLSICKLLSVSFLLALTACTSGSSSGPNSPAPTSSTHPAATSGPSQTFVTINFNVTGNGSGAVLVSDITSGGTVTSCTSPSSPCLVTANVGDVLAISVLQDSNEAFSQWQGCTSVSTSNNGTVCNLTTGTSNSITAIFVPPVYVSGTTCGNGTTEMNGSCYPSFGMCSILNGVGIAPLTSVTSGSPVFGGNCVAQGCSTGYSLSGNSCVVIPAAASYCGNGTALSAGQCVPSSTALTCGQGTSASTSGSSAGQCLPTSTVICGAGTTIGSDSACYANTKACTVGSLPGTQSLQTLNNQAVLASGVPQYSSCVASAASITCGPGTTQVGSSCVANASSCSLPAGTTPTTSGVNITYNGTTTCYAEAISCPLPNNAGSGINVLDFDASSAPGVIAPVYTSTCFADLSSVSLTTCGSNTTIGSDNICYANTQTCAVASTNGQGTQSLVTSNNQAVLASGAPQYSSCVASQSSTCSNGQYWDGSQCTAVATAYIATADFILPINSNSVISSSNFDLNSNNAQLIWTNDSANDGGRVSSNGSFFATSGVQYSIQATMTNSGSNGIALFTNYNDNCTLANPSLSGSSSTDVSSITGVITVAATAVSGEVFNCTVTATNPVGLSSVATVKVTIDPPQFILTMPSSITLNDRFAYTYPVHAFNESTNYPYANNFVCPTVSSGAIPTSYSKGFLLVPPPGYTASSTSFLSNIPPSYTSTSSNSTINNLKADHNNGCLITAGAMSIGSGDDQLDLSQSGIEEGSTQTIPGWTLTFTDDNSILQYTSPPFAITFARLNDPVNNFKISTPLSFMNIVPNLFVNTQTNEEGTSSSGENTPVVVQVGVSNNDSKVVPTPVFDPFNDTAVPTNLLSLFNGSATMSVFSKENSPTISNFTYYDYVPAEPTRISGLTTVVPSLIAPIISNKGPASTINAVNGSIFDTNMIISVSSDSSNLYPFNNTLNIYENNCQYPPCSFTNLTPFTSTFLTNNQTGSQYFVLPGQSATYEFSPLNNNNYVEPDINSSTPQVTYTVGVPEAVYSNSRSDPSNYTQVPVTLNPQVPTGFGSFPDTVFPTRMNQPGGGNSTAYLNTRTNSNYVISSVSGSLDSSGNLLSQDYSNKADALAGPQRIDYPDPEPGTSNVRTFYITTETISNNTLSHISYYDSTSYVSNSFISYPLSLALPSGYTYANSGGFAMFNNNGKLLVVTEIIQNSSGQSAVMIFNLDPFNLTSPSNNSQMLLTYGTGDLTNFYNYSSNYSSNYRQITGLYFDVRDQMVFISNTAFIEVYNISTGVVNVLKFNQAYATSDYISPAHKFIRVAQNKYIAGAGLVSDNSKSVPATFMDFSSSTSTPVARVISPAKSITAGAASSYQSLVDDCYLIAGNYSTSGVQAAFTCDYTISNTIISKLSYWSDTNLSTTNYHPGPVFDMLLDIQDQSSGGSDLPSSDSLPFTFSFTNNTAIVALSSQTGASGYSLYYVSPNTSSNSTNTGFPFSVQRLDLLNADTTSKQLPDNISYPNQYSGIAIGNKLFFSPQNSTGNTPNSVFVIDTSNISSPTITKLFTEPDYSTQTMAGNDQFKLGTVIVYDSDSPSQYVPTSAISDTNGNIFMDGALIESLTNSYTFFGPAYNQSSPTSNAFKVVEDVYGSKILYTNAGRFWIFDSSKNYEYQIEDLNPDPSVSDIAIGVQGSIGQLIGPGAIIVANPSWLPNNTNLSRLLWVDFTGIKSK